MPLREFLCASGHTTSELMRGDDFPRVIECPTCCKPSHYRIAAPAAGIVSGTDNPGGWKRAPERDGFRVLEETPTLVVRQKGADVGVWVEWMCADGHKDGDILDRQPTDTPACASCGKPTAVVAGVPTVDWFTAAGFHATGGYHDDVLGRWVNSLEHRRQILAEMGLAEGGPDSSALLRQAERKAQEEAEDREVWESINTKLPDTPDVRKMREAGLIPDEEWAKEDLRRLYGWK